MHGLDAGRVFLLFALVFAERDLLLQEFEADELSASICGIVTAHEDFEVAFHFDEMGRRLIDRILANMSEHEIKGANLIWYNENAKHSDIFVRPLVRKILHVVILKNLEDMLYFLNESTNVNEHDEALFVLPYPDMNLTFIQTDKHVKLFGKILAINFEDQRPVICTVCYFCGKMSGKLVELSADRRLSFDKKEFLNFYQHVFKVGFTDYYPFIWCEVLEDVLFDNITYTICTKLMGSENEMIKLMARKLNFTFDLVFYPAYKPLLQGLQQGRVDFAIGGITATSERADASTFTRAYQFEGFHYLYIFSSNLKKELGRVLDPFDGLLWLLLATSIFVTSAVLYALDRVESDDIGRISCYDSLWVCLYMAIEQNTKIKQVFKVRPGPAVLLVAWILVCMNVSTAYKSKLSALVMNPPHREPSDLQDLVDEGYTFVVNQRYRDVFVALLMNTSDPVVQYAMSLTEGKPNLCDEFIYAVENRAAILDEYTSLQYEIRRECKGEIRAKRKDTERNGETLIRITKKSLRIIGQVWLLQKRAAYRTGFDLVLSQIVEAGLVEMWKTKYTKEMLKGSFPESHYLYMEHFHNPLSLRLLMSLFLVYALGNSCAFLAFIAESLLHRRFSKVARKSSRYKL